MDKLLIKIIIGFICVFLSFIGGIYFGIQNIPFNSSLSEIMVLTSGVLFVFILGVPSIFILDNVIKIKN